MRFTKIPLIATLMAVALSLLIVLPGLGQARDITDGKLNTGPITVGVFSEIRDAQTAKLVAASGTGAVTGVFVPIMPEPPVDTTGTDGLHEESGDTAHLMTDTSSPRDTLFRNSLYVSNDMDAYNVVLINFRHPAGTAAADIATCKAAPNDADANVTAVVKNNRSGEDITLELALAITTTTVGADTFNHSQAFFKVVAADTPPYTAGPDGIAGNDDDASVPYREFDGPTFCDDATTGHPFDVNTDGTIADDERVANETAATSATYFPVDYSRVADTGLRPAAQEIGTIFARHGDRLTVTIPGTSGQIELVVDGEGPDFTAVTPDDNAVTRSSRLSYGFEVRDDDSGLRHDGESIVSGDGDFAEINPDGDHSLHDEPLSVNPGASVNANGVAADIRVNVKLNDSPPTAFDAPTPLTDTGVDDISASGTWRMAGNRAGVAYVFTASGAGTDEGPYLYQLRARDRAGNWASTDAVADEDDNEADEPYVFRVDDTDPALSRARTGISYDTTKNMEKVDRSYIALEFTGDVLGEVNTDNITVVGHTIVGVIHPSKEPRINRGDRKATDPPSPAPTEPDGDRPTATEPGDAAPTNNGGWTNTFIENALGNEVLAGTVLGRQANLPTSCYADSTVTDGTGGFSTPVNLNEITIPATDTDECALWKSWMVYEAHLDAQRTWDSENTAYLNYVQYQQEHPLRNVDGEILPDEDPRARAYLRLAEPLASDATPAVVVVGGAVYDMAGNTNDAKTIEKSMDWIAPGLTVTVTGTADDRPVANAQGAFNIDVRSDEDLLRRPRVFFVEIDDEQTEGVGTDTTADDKWSYTITEDDSTANVDTASNLALQEDDNHWARSYKVSSIEGHFNGLIGVIVVGYDDEENIGATAGWTKHPHRRDSDPDVTPDEGDKLDLTKLDTAGLLAEIDKVFNNDNENAAGDDIESTIGSVTPRSNDDGTETESANPFVKLEFKYEKDEYEAGPFTDSHDSVEVTEITLGGDNAMANLNRVSATSFSLITRDLAVGSYTVEYTAVDDAGNEFEGEFDFDVRERQPYEISVQPGWNLVSLPATPLDPAIGAVLAGNQYISPVLGYQEGDWVTAIQEEDGTWRGRLTEITGGYGYWVHARTFESIETMLAEVDPAGILPTVPVTAGWNLLGVLDIFQNAEGDPPGEKQADGTFAAGNYDADNYFSSIDWKVAYTYDTTQSLWVKSTPDVDAEDEILNGNGYWVWSPTPNTLVP